MGRRRTSCLRTALLLFLLTFVWLQLHILSLGSNSSDAPIEVNESAIFSMVPPVLHKFLTARQKTNSSGTNSTHGEDSGVPTPLNISEIVRSIMHHNEIQQVYNEDIYGPILNDSVIIVIQVHTRITYLRHLIVSLAQVKEISTALLIFSHDFYDEELNELVQSVDFCKVLQIFYPYSIQTHPSSFPGEDPHDCPRDLKKEQALIRNCNNALYPDLYGHYREAKFTQTKHHWWWKANRVFNQLEITRNHSGMVVFLEEDHYVAEDFLHMLKLMEKTSKEMCAKCNILSLGTYLKTYNYYGDSKKKEALRAIKQHQIMSAGQVPPSWNFQILPSLYQSSQKVEISPWISSKHNMGMAFNRSTWLGILKCAEFFCKYDDYNWDWSLQHISQTCLTRKLHAMVVKGPRVFHIGECGVHHKKNNCAAARMISKVQQVLKVAKKHLYPSYLTLTFTTSNKKQKLRKGNGGWGDHRDHMLCINVTHISN